MNYFYEVCTKKYSVLLVSSCMVLGLGFLIAFIISEKLTGSLKDITFLVGLGVTIIGFMTMMQGNPPGPGVSGFGDKNVQQICYVNFEVTKRERESTNYFKNFKNNSVITSSFISLSIVVGGLLMILCWKVFL